MSSTWSFWGRSCTWWRPNVTGDMTKRWKTDDIATYGATARSDHSSFCHAASGPCRSCDLRGSYTIVRARTKSGEPALLMIVMGTLRRTYGTRGSCSLLRWCSLVAAENGTR